ncbi:MAG: hypothetical protein EP330_05360 [Deltaproteobacteria bacterium]|nr:MAG: hypothetical protein EP330_05360 [Deltaproteobacteria bacterium]
MSRLLPAAILLALGTGCSMKIRNVTAEAWSEDGAYVAYWEGTCKPILGCDRGDGKVMWCVLDPSTNAMTCTEQEAISPLLSRKQMPTP